MRRRHIQMMMLITPSVVLQSEYRNLNKIIIYNLKHFHSFYSEVLKSIYSQVSWNPMMWLSEES